jgi:uncharacterized repeat protein (TIGR01451 family)
MPKAFHPVVNSLSPARSVSYLAFVVALALTMTVSAQQQDVRVDLTARRVVLADGKESLLAADKAKPGDVIQYDAIYKNTGKAAVQNVGATVPIPAGLALVAESAKPAAEQASLDGKNFSAFPLTRDVKNDAGVVEKQPVPLEQYRALRWSLPELAPGATATVSLRARVVTGDSAK